MGPGYFKYTTAPLPAKEFSKILATFYVDVLIIFRCYSSILSSLFIVTLLFSILHPRSIVHSSCKGGGPRGPRLNIHRAYVLGKERRLLIGNIGFLDTN